MLITLTDMEVTTVDNVKYAFDVELRLVPSKRGLRTFVKSCLKCENILVPPDNNVFLPGLWMQGFGQ